MKPVAADLLAFVRDYAAARGYAPSYDEMAVALRVSVGQAHAIVASLIAAGQMTRQPGRARSLVVVDRGHVCPRCGYSPCE